MNYVQRMMFEDTMNESELEPITKDWRKPILKNTLIGFKGLGDSRGITAAYPVWSFDGYEIQFVLYISKHSGRPVIDNTWITSSDLYINKEPIIV